MSREERIKHFLNNAKSMTDYQIECELNNLLRDYSLRNLKDNRDLILDTIKKYKRAIRLGGLSRYTALMAYTKFYRKRAKLNLTKNDLDDLKEFFRLLRKR